jgi:hypothetical protein
MYEKQTVMISSTIPFSLLVMAAVNTMRNRYGQVHVNTMRSRLVRVQ